MNSADVIEIMREAIYTLLLVGSPLLLLAMAVGLGIGIIQTLTQIQEMTLVFVPKIIILFLGLLFLLPFIISKMNSFSEGLFDRMVALR